MSPAAAPAPPPRRGRRLHALVARLLAGDDADVAAGEGEGHGVGPCQVGAYGMALDGATFDEILTKYYKGIELKQLY